MRSLIIIEVEHGETTDGLNEALFNFGIGSQLDPQADDQWPTADDGGTWPNLAGMDYQVTDYTVRVDLPEGFVLDSSGITYRATHQHIEDSSPAMEVWHSDTTITLVNEDGHRWTDDAHLWTPIVLDSPVWLHEDGTVCEAGPAEGATDWCDEHDRDLHRQTIEN